MPNLAAIEMRNISFSYGDVKILENFDLSIESGKVYCLVGSSGSGKTTALKIINGLVRPQEGELFHDGKAFDFSNAATYRRTMGYSIQGSGLFPHMSLEENLSIIARKEGWNSKKIRDRILELCELVNLPSTNAFLAKKPREISGGQQQRVGIARALFMKPKIMLMDEPFSALDPITRKELQQEFLSLQAKLQVTIVLVTHDLSEAFKMAHEMVLLNKGRVEQKGAPSKFLLSPNSTFVSDFIESHSPGNILKEVYLYSVINTDFYSSTKQAGCILIQHLDGGPEHTFSTIDEATAFLQQQGQQAHYWVDDDSVFLDLQDFDGNSSRNSVQATQHILEGMKLLLQSNRDTLPIVNRDNKLIGVFSEEALNAL